MQTACSFCQPSLLFALLPGDTDWFLNVHSTFALLSERVVSYGLLGYPNRSCHLRFYTSTQVMGDTETRRLQIEEMMAVIEEKLAELDGERKELAEYMVLDKQRRWASASRSVPRVWILLITPCSPPLEHRSEPLIYQCLSPRSFAASKSLMH